MCGLLIKWRVVIRLDNLFGLNVGFLGSRTIGSGCGQCISFRDLLEQLSTTTKSNSGGEKTHETPEQIMYILEVQAF